MYQPYLDKLGSKIGTLTFIDLKKENQRSYFLMRCDCGNEWWVRAESPTLKKGKCPVCSDSKDRYKDLTGQKFSRLIVLKKVGKTKFGALIWRCKCDCGNVVDVVGGSLKNGHTKSCGCIHKEFTSNIGKTVGVKSFEKDIIDGANVRAHLRETSRGRSGVKGVMWNSQSQKWVAELDFKKKRYYLGSFDNIKEAQEAREKAFNEIVQPFLDGIKKD